MQSLELKIPPPVITLTIAVAMWGISLAASPTEAPTLFGKAVAAAIALLGGGVSLSGMLAFRRVGTTYSPHRPERTSSLVATGAYRRTRNPMYVGLLFVLIAWSVYLFSAWSLIGPVFFVLYIGRFHIAPEERVLAAKFGSDYVEYCTQVRRWL